MGCDASAIMRQAAWSIRSRCWRRCALSNSGGGPSHRSTACAGFAAHHSPPVGIYPALTRNDTPFRGRC
eukprot:475915-Pleurochrysis_carterae.AAC.1